MGVRGSSKRRRRASSADLISGLTDDLLLRIIEQLPDARDAVRTGALSRRWRGLWTRAAALRFASSGRRNRKFRGASGAKRFLAFVRGSLAQTDGAAAALEHLAISFAMFPVGKRVKQLVPRSMGAAQGWIRHAAQRAVRSFVLELSLPLRQYRDHVGIGDNDGRQPMLNLDELPSSGKLETMRLALGGARLQLPAAAAAAVFTSLADLSLESVEFAAGSARLLARVLSSACCPRLQKLRLEKLVLPGLKDLLIDAGELSELTYMEIRYPRALELRTPSLRVLSMMVLYWGYPDKLEISAPRLEEITFLGGDQPECIHIDGELPCMRSLTKVHLYSYGEDDDGINDGSIRLLQCCTSSLTSLDVSLEVTERDDGEVDIISGRIPYLPHLISLTVDVFLPDDLHYSFGVGLADILTQCRSRLKYLRVHCRNITSSHEQQLELCNHPDHYESHEMYLGEMEEVEFTGLAGTDCERWLVQRVLTSAPQVEKVTVSFDRRCRLEEIQNASEKFMIPLLGGGTWITARRQDGCWSCEWN